jgi:hypothetical protein
LVSLIYHPRMPNYPSQTADRFLVRLPDGMRERLAESAREHNRTMTKDVVARLAASFESKGATLPPFVQDAVDDEIEARGGTPEEALTRLVLLGQSKGGTVFQVTIQPGAKLQDISTVIEAAKLVIPPDADMFVERK